MSFIYEHPVQYILHGQNTFAGWKTLTYIHILYNQLCHFLNITIPSLYYKFTCNSLKLVMRWLTFTINNYNYPQDQFPSIWTLFCNNITLLQTHTTLPQENINQIHLCYQKANFSVITASTLIYIEKVKMLTFHWLNWGKFAGLFVLQL